MLDGAGLEAVSIWEFGQDVTDLIISAANNAELEESDFIDQISALADEMQKVVDEKSLSDVIFIVAVKS